MSKDKLVPKLRFKEYKNHLGWVKHTFGEIANYRKGPFGSALKKSIFVPKSQESVKIYEQQNAIDKNWKLERYFITKEYANKMKSFEVNPGDIIVSSAGTIGETYILPEDAEPGIINQALMRIGVNESKISKTLYIHLFENMIEDFSNKYSHGSAMKNIPPFSDLKSAETYFPSTEEQEELVEFLKLFKIMINVQKLKLNKVKDLKSAYLSEMFPKEGEKYPKKRFEGFTKPWKLTKFNEIADVERGLTYHPSDIVEKGGVRVLRSSNIDEDTFITKDDDVFVNENAINIEFSQKQNILITSANGSPHLVGKHAILEQLETPSVHGGFMLLARTASPYFLNASMSSDWYRKFIRYHVAGGGGSIGNIKKSDLEHQLIYIPSKEEQEKIGQFFKNLDNQISIEEEKLAKLEKLKQAYLNDMFV